MMQWWFSIIFCGSFMATNSVSNPKLLWVWRVFSMQCIKWFIYPLMAVTRTWVRIRGGAHLRVCDIQWRFQNLCRNNIFSHFLLGPCTVGGGYPCSLWLFLTSFSLCVHRYEQVILENVTVTGNSEEAMLVPSVTKYNEIYMPDVQTLEESHRMSNITYEVYNSTFNYNGMYFLLSLHSIIMST